MTLVTCRFLAGSGVLLLVNILWVTSSEITEYLYHEKNFNKPFFTAYIKSILFSIYLFGFIFCDSWWSQSSHQNNDYYSIVADSDQQNLATEDEENNDDQGNDELDLAPSSEDVSINCDSQEVEQVKPVKVSGSNFLSESVWLPIKRSSDTSSLSGKSSETEDDDISSDGHVFIENNPSNSILSDHKNSKIHSNVNFTKASSADHKKTKKKKDPLSQTSKKGTHKRAVRFSKLIEVRQLSDKHADDAFLSRLSYSSFVRILQQRNRQRQEPKSDSQLRGNFNSFPSVKLSIRETAILAFYFTWIWFAAHLSFHMALQYSEAGLVNILSSTTPLFTLLLGILFPSGSMTDSLSLTKLLCVMISISSVAMISNTEPVNHSHSHLLRTSSTKSNILHETILPLGSIWSLCGAFFYAVYIVLMRYNLSHDSMLNFPMFFGFIGFFSMAFMWPIILLLNFTQIELFEWPDPDQWLLILVNGLCGTVISELLWLLGSFMTSSLVGTISVSLTIPMAVFFDIFFKDIEYPRIFFLTAIPMFFSFVVIIIISQYDNWDPVLIILEKCIHSLGSSGSRPGGKIINAETNILDPDGDDDEPEIASIPDSSEDQSTSTINENQSSNNNISTVSNNRRFENKGFFNGKKDSESTVSPSSNSSSSSTMSSRHFGFNRKMEDEDQEQTQSLIEANNEDSVYI